jgi:preprotein translocase subunit SecF
MSMIMLFAIDDTKAQKIELKDQYEYKVNINEIKTKKVCVKDNIKIYIPSNEVAQKEKDGNIELEMYNSKEHSYEIENCYTIGPK